MFDKIRNNLISSKIVLLFNKAANEGKITPFDEDFYKEMSHTIFNCIPVSMHIKYLRPTSPPGKCYDRSLYMFLCFDDAVLVRGDVKDLEVKFGKDHAGHGWIEKGNYVYDPSHLLRYEKDAYYKIYNPSNLLKVTTEEYKKENAEFYDDIKNSSIDEYRPGGSKRTDLCVTMPLVRGIADMSDNEEFQKDLDEYLTLIEYDEKQIHEELMERCSKLF